MKGSTKKELISLLRSIGLAVGVVFITRQFILIPTTVSGESMLPTFQDKDKIIVSKITNIDRFNIIVFDAPDKDNELYVKRVIGLPGDHVEVKDDMLYINREPIDEPYLTAHKENNPLIPLTENFTLQEKFGVAVVPEGMLFVMGDNRLRSKDSRDFGLISQDALIGEVKFRYYPLQEIGVPH